MKEVIKKSLDSEDDDPIPDKPEATPTFKEPLFYADDEIPVPTIGGSDNQPRELPSEGVIAKISMISDANDEEGRKMYYSETQSVADSYLRAEPPDDYRGVEMIYPHLEISMSQTSEDESSFSVADPVIGSHVTYSVKGIDNDGPFEG
jgi:hypothetical protein